MVKEIAMFFMALVVFIITLAIISNRKTKNVISEDITENITETNNINADELENKELV